jgi:hypothetical protein
VCRGWRGSNPRRPAPMEQGMPALTSRLRRACLYNILKLCASKSNFMFFNISVSLSDPAWTAVAPTQDWIQIVVCTLHCQATIASSSCAARASLSHCSRGCTRRCRTGRTGCSTGSIRQSSARTSRVRQAEPGSGVAVTIMVIVDIKGQAL